MRRILKVTSESEQEHSGEGNNASVPTTHEWNYKVYYVNHCPDTLLPKKNTIHCAPYFVMSDCEKWMKRDHPFLTRL